MYNFKIDIREKDNSVIYGVEAGGHYELYIEDGDTKIKLTLSYEQLDKTMDSLLEQCGEKSYSELQEENDRLSEENDEYKYQKELDEEYEDYKREKYREDGPF
ncbi:hypothetical protein [Clostridium sardiniense]|uniref:hypothetical protein n=1 Tax=Clostridium sardiniense TaxID=29369 RepID=UPI00195D9E10|nr:hypothetical protein [Clostridium sardiniense]MBM7835920.1 vacuolar-type H+-ATPase subunit I/STV1 [Clostridium sardiniense]